MGSAVLIPVISVTGEVYDQADGLLLAVTSTGTFDEYNLRTQQMQSSTSLAAGLSGLAITSDGGSVLVGVAPAPNTSVNVSQDTVLRVDIHSLAETALTFAAGATDTGVASVAVGADGRAYVSTSDSNNGFESLTAFSETATNPLNPAVINGEYFSAPLHLASSETGRYILAAPENISNGPINVIDTKSGQVVAATDLAALGYTGYNTGNEDISDAAGLVADSLGQQVIVLGHDLSLTQDLTSGLHGDTISGVHFAEGGQELLLWDSTADSLLVYDTSTWSQTEDFALPSSVAGPAQGAFNVSGGMIASLDGTLVFLNTTAGVQEISVPQTQSPLALGEGEVATTSNQTLHAPASGNVYFEADGANDRVALTGDVGDYTLSRVQPTSVSGASDAQVGAFLLTANNGTGAYAVEEGVSTVQFQNGQYLSLKDLPSYVHGDASLQMGGSGDDLLFQTPSNAYELFIGGGGNDTVYLNGNVGDYTLKSFTALTPLGENGTGGQSYSGLELVGDNGSGLLLIDSSVETVQFKDGQYLSYNDLHAYIATDTTSSSDVLNVGLDGDFGEPLVYQGASGANRALLNGNVGDYTLSRDASGDFVLDEHYATNGVEDTLTLTQNVEGVQFHNGQYLSLKDLGAYIPGSDVFTQGTAGNDLLFLPLSGDQYVVGGAGTDNLYLNGNTHDYTIKAVDLAAANGHPAIDGYELVGDNGSGNIYIDQSTEIIHFQNGQYLAFHDLPAYVDPFHG